MTSTKHTGLNTYHVRLLDGSYVYDASCGTVGGDERTAQTWLWTPEQAPDEVERIAAATRWPSRLRAERCR